jgi:hypothetical protein
VLCRGQIEIKRLHWEDSRIELILRSDKKQSIILETPSEIRDISVTKGSALIHETDRKNNRRISMPAGQDVTLEIETRSKDR